MFVENEIVIVNQNAIKGIPLRIGERAVIVQDDYYRESKNYDYKIEFDDSTTCLVKESELNKLTQEDKKYMDYIFTGNQLVHKTIDVKVKILKVDYINKKAEVAFDGGGSDVIDFEKLIATDSETEGVVEELNTPKFENLFNIFLKHYENEDGTYTVPKQFLKNLLDNIFEE